MIPLASLAASALPLAKRALPFALPLAGAGTALLIGWLWIGYPNGHEDGHAEGLAEGIAQGREAAVLDFERQSLDRQTENARARREAESEVRDALDPIRLPGGELDPDGLRARCAADPNCRGPRLLGEPDPLEHGGHGPDDRGDPETQRGAREAVPGGE